MLRHATFPDIWSRRGYPDNPFLATLKGEVLHGALEVIVRAMATHHCDGHDGPCRVIVLKDLGGYSVVLRSVSEAVLSSLHTNPRVARRMDAIRRALTLEMPELRRGVQTTIARSDVVAGTSGATPRSSEERTRAIGIGSHAEVELRVPSMGWIGKADLISLDADNCRITDYKTGVPQEDHEAQLRIYALLWARDAAVNPSGRIATELVVAYPTREEVFPAPDRDELDRLEDDLRTRSAAALGSMIERPPTARPEATFCSHCQVRQLCNPYWDHLADSVASGSVASADRAIDVELLVDARNGPRTWLATVQRGFGIEQQRSVVIRSHEETAAYGVGELMRVLNVRIERDEEHDLIFLATSDYSEVFPLTNRAPSGGARQ